MTNFNNISSEKDLHSLIIKAGFILSNLRETLRELGFDETLTQVAGSIPDARERLAYVISIAENAVTDVFNSIELVQPCQNKLAYSSKELALCWDGWNKGDLDKELEKKLALDTVNFLITIPENTSLTRHHLQSIMMSQGFYDITEQIIRRMTKVLTELEQHFIQILRGDVELLSNESKLNHQLENGNLKPLSNQDDVDDILSSIGF
ncbi:protein phosphatase CheZ [Pantoea sp. Fr+CA_20]|uniref:protein phosphatase CheZ n=1 Tax=Pantoea sp. Fr+CA_20 TaxID=2929506 RepID=UPI00211805FA|nr:protein phosphatase CheZ [Pantoea sp. Fr+CA_20]